MIFTLKDAAKYWKSSRASKAFLSLIDRIKRIFTFTEERANRLKRFQQIADDYKANMPISEIEVKYGCSRTTVLNYARLAGLEKRPKGDKDRRKAIVALYQQDKPIAEIAALMGVSKALVSKIASEEGINRRKFKKKVSE